MNYERSKAPLALMEQIIMILVFALTAAVCLQAFVYSDSLSKQGEKRDVAAKYAQQVAEYLKQEKDMELVCADLSGKKTKEGIEISYPEDHMVVCVMPRKEESNEYLLVAQVSVKDEKNETIFSIDTAYQRGGGDRAE